MAKKTTTTARAGLSDAIRALEKAADEPLFHPPIQRSISCRYVGLGALLSGPVTPGIPTGTIIEVLGSAHSGKTTLAFAIADAIINQPADATHRVLTREGVREVPVPRKVLYLDFEHALSMDYMRSAIRDCRVMETDENGRAINPGEANMIIAQPRTLEQGGDIAVELVRTREIGMVVFDSIAAMLPKEEHEKSMGDRTVGAQARAVGMLLRKITGEIRSSACVMVAINQWREKIGVSFGDPRVAPGGKALEFYESIRLDVGGPKKTPWFDDGHGKTCSIKTKKNKVTGKLGTITMHIGASVGLSAEVELIERAAEVGAISFRGPNQSVTIRTKSGPRKWKTAREFAGYLRGNTRVFDTLLAAIEKHTINTASSDNGGFGEDIDP